MAYSSSMQQVSTSMHLLAAALPLFVCACSGDVVNVGENSAETSSELAAAACPPAGTVVVSNQAEIEALEGCEAIAGDLYVVPFEGADLGPLHALRSIQGALRFGAAPGTVDGMAVNRIAELEAAGWLSSLSGLESLEQVGWLYLAGFSGSDLTALSNLRVVTDGSLYITSCSGNLRNLHGLENLAAVDTLYIDCDGLEDLTGLPLRTSITSLTIAGGFKGSAPLGVHFVVGDLILRGTDLESLDAFVGLEYVGGALIIQDNPVLADASGLSSLTRLRALLIRGNPALQHLPSLSGVERLDSLVIDGTALLELPPFSGLSRDPEVDPTQTSEPSGRVGRLQVSDNSELRRVDVPAGWRSGADVTVTRNAALEQLNLAQLATVDRLEIDANPLLATVGLEALWAAYSLHVRDNPLLAEGAFDAVQSVEREMSGNADNP